MLENKIWRWLDEVVIGEQLCPFAKKPRHQDKIFLYVSKAKSHETTLEIVAEQLSYLTNNPDIDTTLLALEHGYEDFFNYLDLVDAAQALLEELGFEGIFQLASFHPNYMFDAEPTNSNSHFTNRSPCPIIHILREQDITKALATTASPEAIPERNIAHTEKLGADFFKKYL